jgi:DNA-binding transcriptional MocR family regulator
LSYTLTVPQVIRMLGQWRGAGPAYTDLAEALQALIGDGRLPAGARVPAERTLAAQCGVSRNTVTAAYQLLRERGFLASGRGAGSFARLPEGAERPLPGPAAESPAGSIDLAVASLPAPEAVLGAATLRASGDLVRYSHLHGNDVAGVAELRRALAADFSRRGAPTAPEQILVTAGARHALGLIIRLLSRPNDAVLTDSPTCPSVLDLTRAMGRRVLTVGLDAEGWHTDVWQSALRQESPRLAFLVPDHHNPTGLVMPDAARGALVAAARDSGTYLVVDEALRELALDGAPAPRPMAGDAAAEHVITVGTLSKTCWAGLRVGWIRASIPVVNRLIELRSRVDTGNSLLTQLIGLRVLEHHELLLGQRREQLRERRQLLTGLLARDLPQWRFSPPAGGLSLWVDLGAPVASALTRAAARRGVAILPGGRFGMDGTLERRIRLPFTADERALTEGCARLADAWRDVRSAAPGSRGLPAAC